MGGDPSHLQVPGMILQVLGGSSQWDLQVGKLPRTLSENHPSEMLGEKNVRAYGCLGLGFDWA